MNVFNNLHAFVWQSMTANNCNTYLIDGPTRVLIDPGHSRLFDHVVGGLKQLGLAIKDIDVLICTHAHPDHIEAVQLFKDIPTRFTLHEAEWQWAVTIGKQMSAAFGIDMDAIMPDFFLREGNLSLDGALEVGLFDLGGGLFDPQLGDSFDLFTADTIVGEFDILTMALLGEGLGWQLDFLPDAIGTLDVARLSVVASTVPIPVSVWLFGSGLIGLIGIARRRSNSNSIGA